jgi:CYTH domain-containing protein
MEIERKFLVDLNKSDKIFKGFSLIDDYSIFQGYFFTDNTEHEFRIRLIKRDKHFESAYLTIKNKTTDLSREEIELSIDVKEALDILEHKCTCYNYKYREVYQFQDKIIEFNKMFLSKPAFGLIEIEFNSEEEAADFDYKLILQLHEKYKNKNFTDDSLLCEEENIPVAIVEGKYENIKITNLDDIK